MHTTHRLNLDISNGKMKIHVVRVSYSIFMKTVPKHQHGRNLYELHYITNGKGKLILKDKIINLKKGDYFITGPFVIHSQVSDNIYPLSEYCLNIECEDISKFIPVEKEEIKNFFTSTETNILSIFEAIYNEVENNRINKEMCIEAYIKLLLVETCRMNKKINIQTTGYSDKVPTRNSLFIDELFLSNYSDINLQSLSSALNLSCRQTERLLFDTYGKTFRQKKQEARMSAALELLNSNLSITEIAEILGYSSNEHFITAFKQNFSITPLKYRKQLKEYNSYSIN